MCEHRSSQSGTFTATEWALFLQAPCMQTPQRNHTERFQYRVALKWIDSCCVAFVENILTEVSMCETVTVNNLSCENHFSANPKMFFCWCREAQHFLFVYSEVTRHDSMHSERLCSHLWLLVLTKEPLDASGTILNPSAYMHMHAWDFRVVGAQHPCSYLQLLSLGCPWSELAARDSPIRAKAW